MDEERFLKQKAKIDWLNVGDSNSAYFHQVVKTKKARNRIDAVMDANGKVCDGDQVVSAFLNHYLNFLGQDGGVVALDTHDLFVNGLSSEQALEMIKPVSGEEIKQAMFSMGDDKSPGPDGFSACFFKHAWDIIGKDVILAIQDFFASGKLLKELNHTIISLIPKVDTPSRINDFRPISLCNVLFKCITNIIANRLKDSLDQLVGVKQLAFVPERRISDNIL
ncbi:MAG TPA: hypothetical protein VFI70_11805, partial [Nitrososphaeraceae archaeon]|nr:hypothetical protein [Nitrososphaeraceae archaeon]